MEKATKLVEYYKDDRGQSIIGPSTATIFYGQCGEDLEVYVDFIAKNKEAFRNNGTYIEVGGSDGVKFSNTKFFEDDLGFTGVLIEPVPEFFSMLQKTRPNNSLYNCIVSESEEPQDFLISRGPGGGWVSGMEKTMSEKNKFSWHGQNSSLIKIQTDKISSIVKKSGLKYVDLFFIDVEGAEKEVLETVDFSVPIYVIVIELDGTNEEKDNECREILEQNGFTFHKKCALSDIWYNENYFDVRGR